jgi:hypothetical protein
METTFRYPVYHLILHWKRRLANPRRVDVSLPRVSFNSTLDSLPLQLCSQPLTGNSFAIDRLGTEPLPVSCALDLIPSSLFLEMMTTLDVWMEVLVLEPVRLILAWLISAYSLSHNTIQSTSRALLNQPAEQTVSL